MLKRITERLFGPASVDQEVQTNPAPVTSSYTPLSEQEWGYLEGLLRQFCVCYRYTNNVHLALKYYNQNGQEVSGSNPEGVPSMRLVVEDRSDPKTMRIWLRSPQQGSLSSDTALVYQYNNLISLLERVTQCTPGENSHPITHTQKADVFHLKADQINEYTNRLHGLLKKNAYVSCAREAESKFASNQDVQQYVAIQNILNQTIAGWPKFHFGGLEQGRDPIKMPYESDCILLPRYRPDACHGVVLLQQSENKVWAIYDPNTLDRTIAGKVFKQSLEHRTGFRDSGSMGLDPYDGLNLNVTQYERHPILRVDMLKKLVGSRQEYNALRDNPFCFVQNGQDWVNTQGLTIEEMALRAIRPFARTRGSNFAYHPDDLDPILGKVLKDAYDQERLRSLIGPHVVLSINKDDKGIVTVIGTEELLPRLLAGFPRGMNLMGGLGHSLHF